MKGQHIIILAYYFSFLAGMVVGAALAQKPLYWILVIILTAIGAALMVVPLGKPRKKKLPRHNVRIVR
jgi:predicted cobalt transporter CbtA